MQVFAGTDYKMNGSAEKTNEAMALMLIG